MSTTEKTMYIGLVGTGGFAREVMPLLKSQFSKAGEGTKVELFYIDLKDSEPMNGTPVISEEKFLAIEGDKFFNIAIADSKLREKISAKYEAHGCLPVSIKSDNAIEIGGNDIGAGHIISPFSCVTADAKIGKYFHCNIYSYVAHDCTIGDFVTFAPRVCCNGNVVIEDHAYIGTGAVLKQGTPERPLIIGKGAVVGMGAVVTKNVPAGAVVVGNPAKPLTK